MVLNPEKVLFVDTEGGIAVERIKQISSDHEKVLQRIFFFNPVTFAEQNEAFEKLNGLVNESVGMIVVDSISMLYRLELGKMRKCMK